MTPTIKPGARLEPTDKLGFTKEEVLKICRDRKIHHKTFWKAFGVNTVGVSKDGTDRFYKCDVQMALYKLNKPGGKWMLWD